MKPEHSTRSQAGAADTRPRVPADLTSALQAPGCAAYVEEARAGGVSMIVALYPR
jgi:hypothetical protein